jgi:hypothetical protein
VSPKRPIAVRAVLDPGDSRTPPDDPEHTHHYEDDLLDAVRLYQWSRTALQPIGETIAARLTVAD